MYLLYENIRWTIPFWFICRLKNEIAIDWDSCSRYKYRGLSIFYFGENFNRTCTTTIIFRTKIINNYSGFVTFVNNKKDLFQRTLQVINRNYTLENSNILVLNNKNIFKKYILMYKNFYYWVNLQERDSVLNVNTQLNKYFSSQKGT